MSELTSMSDDQRRQVLTLGVQEEVLRGAHVETQSDFTAIVRFNPRTLHWLHLLLTVGTLGIWVVIWITMYAIHSSQRTTVLLTVDEAGQLHRQKT